MAEFGIVSFVVRIEHSKVLGGQKWLIIVQIEVGINSPLGFGHSADGHQYV